MNIWPRRISFVLLIVVSSLAVASVSGVAQSVDSDTAEVGLIVTSSECLNESNSVSSSVVAYSANGWRSDLGPMMHAQTESPEEGDCADETATVTSTETNIVSDRAVVVETPTSTAVATDAVAGSSSTAPVVAQLPETGVAPGNSASTPVLAVTLTAGFLFLVGGVISSRTGAIWRVE